MDLLTLFAFTVAYGVFEIPVGRWGDRIGPRLVLPRIALWVGLALLGVTVAAALALGGAGRWWQEHLLGEPPPRPIPDELLRDRTGRPLRGGARASR